MVRWWFLAIALLLAALSGADRAGAQDALPPAEYKPLPVGTRLVYDNFTCMVARSEGFDTTCNVEGKRQSLQLFGHFFLHGKWVDIGYFEALSSATSGAGRADIVEFKLGEDVLSRLRGLWPLTVGAVIDYEFDVVIKVDRLKVQTGRALVRVIGEETIPIAGIAHRTIVVQETTRIEIPGVRTDWVVTPAKSTEFERTWWYDPGQGIVLKAGARWTKGDDRGKWSESQLIRVESPPG